MLGEFQNKDVSSLKYIEGRNSTSENRTFKNFSLILRREKERIKYIHMHLKYLGRIRKKQKYYKKMQRHSRTVIHAVSLFIIKGKELLKYE